MAGILLVRRETEQFFWPCFVFVLFAVAVDFFVLAHSIFRVQFSVLISMDTSKSTRILLRPEIKPPIRKLSAGAGM